MKHLSSSLILTLAAAFAPLIVTAQAPGGQTRRAITHEDLWLMPRISAPVVSPDGRNVVFVLTQPAYKLEDQTSDLWLVPSDGSVSARRLTSNKAAEGGPTWSPDSRRIAFSARREGDDANQIYVLDVAAGGEAQRVTTISTGARMPKFSPDGTRIAFTSDVPPASQSDADSKRIVEEERARKHNVRTYTGFPIRNWDKWLPHRQPRVLVQTIGKDDARDVLAGTRLVQQRGYAGRTTPGGSELDVVWAPDGRSLVFVASSNADRAAHDYTSTDLWQISIDGGELRRLTGGESASSRDDWSEPSFGPDGSTLFALHAPRGARVFSATHLGALDWPSGTKRQLISAPDRRDVIRYTVAPNGKDVLLLAEDAGHVKVYRGDARGGEAKLVVDMKAGMYDNLSGSGNGSRPTFIGTFESAVSPPEVVRIDLQKGTHHALTRFSADRVAALDMAPLEHFWFESRGGKRIHNMLVRPPGFDPAQKYPLLVLMHGGPHTMWRDNFFLRWNYHLIAAPGYVVLLTNYTGSTGFGEAFAQGIQGDPLEGPANEINEAADQAISRYAFIDGERQCAGGASYGGHLANWMQASTQRYRCLISHAGLVNLESQWATSDIAYSREAGMGGPPWELAPVWSAQNPIRHAAKWRTPVLVTVGEKDFRVPLNNVLEYWTALQRQQVESRLLVYPDENHWILQGGNSKHFYGELHDWLARWLGSPPRAEGEMPSAAAAE